MGTDQDFAPGGAGARHAHRPRQVRPRLSVGLVLREVLIVLACGVSATFATVFADIRSVGVAGVAAGDIAPLTFPSLLVGWGLAVLLLWRRRAPWIVLGMCCGAPLLLWLDSSAALVAMVTVLIGARRNWQVAIAPVTAWVATVVALWRDTRGHQVPPNDATSLWNWTSDPWPLYVVVVVSLLLVGAAFGIGMFLRSRGALATAESGRAQAEERVRHLDTEIHRRVERERIAQEVHDALGHRLSLMSMQAGALEFTAEDSTVAEQATGLRENAQQAMTDLRSLLAMLHESADQDVAQTPHTIDDVPKLVDEALASGAPVVAAMSVSGTEALNPVVSHSAYRIAQELLTNARKHAQGIALRLNVTANPQLGVEIAAANRLPEGADADAQVHSGTGLVGVTERATQCGGQSRYWVDADRVFRVAIRLPWELPKGMDDASTAGR